MYVHKVKIRGVMLQEIHVLNFVLAVCMLKMTPIEGA